QLSCPRSTGPGTANHSHALRPVCASSATTLPRNPVSPAVPTNTRPLAYIGAPETPCPARAGSIPTYTSHATSPVFSRSAMTRALVRPANTRPSPTATPSRFGSPRPLRLYSLNAAVYGGVSVACCQALAPVFALY